MEYTIAFEEFPDHLRAVIEGESDTYEITQQYWAEVTARCRQANVKRLFIEERLKRQIPTVADTYQAAAERHEMGLTGVKIAFYDADPEQYDQNLFGELVARNRGINVKVFNDRDEALEWLLSE